MNKTELLEKAEKEIKDIIKLRKEWLKDAHNAVKALEMFKLLPDFSMEIKRFYMWQDNEADIELPYDRALIAEVRAKMKAAGFDVESEVEEKDIKNASYNPCIVFSHSSFEGFSLKIEFDDGYAESTCKRKKIGSKIVKREENIYEWSCEGDEEDE